VSERSAAPIGVALGVVLLGAVAAFGIALPKATDDEAAKAEEIVLPDELPHGLVAQDQLGGEIAERYDEAQKSGAEGLENLYGDPAAVRGYASEDGAVQATLVVLDRPPGLFEPHGPPIAPEVLGLERSVFEMRRVGDAVCDLYWQQPVPEGQTTDETADPAAVQCQLGDGDRTFEFLGSGLSAEEAVEVLEAVVQDQ
jgi:hypothetical protein